MICVDIITLIDDVGLDGLIWLVSFCCVGFVWLMFCLSLGFDCFSCLTDCCFCIVYACVVFVLLWFGVSCRCFGYWLVVGFSGTCLICFECWFV